MTDNPSATEKSYQELYQAGVRSFEHGDYKQAIAHFQQALNGVNAGTKIGGEIQVWLAMPTMQPVTQRKRSPSVAA